MIGWQTYSPSSYAWDILTPQGFSLNPFNGDVPEGVNEIANIVFGTFSYLLNTMLQFLTFAIDPSKLISEIAKQISGVVQSSYQTIFLQIFPAAFAVAVIFLLYRFIRSHQASIVQIIGMIVLVSGFGMFFYFHFDTAISSFSKVGDTISSFALEITSGSDNVNNSLSDIWDDFVLNEWELGEFNAMSAAQSDFDVSAAEIQSGQTYSDVVNGTTIQKHLETGDNWITLMLSRPYGDDGRYDLAKILFSPTIQRGTVYTNAQPVSPDTRLILAFTSWLPEIPAFLYVGLMSCLLLAYSFGFVGISLTLIVVIPLGLIPDYGWNLLFRTLRKIAGMLIGKVLSSLYLGISLLALDITTVVIEQLEKNFIVICADGFICALSILGWYWFMKVFMRRLPERYRPPTVIPGFNGRKRDGSKVREDDSNVYNHRRERGQKGNIGKIRGGRLADRVRKSHVQSAPIHMSDDSNYSQPRSAGVEAKTSKGNLRQRMSKEDNTVIQTDTPPTIRARRWYGQPQRANVYRVKSRQGTNQNRMGTNKAMGHGTRPLNTTELQQNERASWLGSREQQKMEDPKNQLVSKPPFSLMGKGQSVKRANSKAVRNQQRRSSINAREQQREIPTLKSSVDSRRVTGLGLSHVAESRGVPKFTSDPSQSSKKGMFSARTQAVSEVREKRVKGPQIRRTVEKGETESQIQTLGRAQGARRFKYKGVAIRSVTGQQSPRVIERNSRTNRTITKTPPSFG